MRASELVGPADSAGGILHRSTADASLCLRDLETLSCRWQIASVGGDGQVLVAAKHFALERPDRDGRSIMIGDLSTGTASRTIRAPSGVVGHLDDAGRYVAVHGKAIDVWDPQDPVHTFSEYSPPGSALQIETHSRHGGYVLRIDPASGALSRADTRSGAIDELWPCTPADRPPTLVAVDETGRAALYRKPGTLCIHHPNRTEPTTVAIADGAVQSLALAPGGEAFAVAFVDGSVQIDWDASGPPTRTAPGDTINHLQFTANDRLVSATRTGIVQVHTPEETWTLRSPPLAPPFLFASSSQGGWLVVVTRDPATVTVYDLTAADRPPVPINIDLSDEVGRAKPSIIFSAKGPFAAAVSDDGTKSAVGDGGRVYFISLGRFGNREGGKSVNGLSFSRDGDLLFANIDGEIRAWNTPTSHGLLDLRRTMQFERSITLGQIGQGSILPVTASDELIALTDRGVHRWKLGLVPGDPDALRRWFEQQASRLHIPGPFDP